MNIRRLAFGATVVAVLVVVVIVSASHGATAVRPPKFARSVDIGLISGTVIVTPSTGRSFRLGLQDRNVPVGSELDTTYGKVDLRSAVPPAYGSAAPSRTKVQDAQFSGALFKIRQRRSQGGLAELVLVTTRKLARLCTAGTAAVAASRRLSSRVLQTLRAHDTGGRFRTRGRFSAATVRGTVWYTSERCDGTYTIVHHGSVYVYDYYSRKTTIVYAGQSYLAKVPPG
jgi:hypothetical protein